MKNAAYVFTPFSRALGDTTLTGWGEARRQENDAMVKKILARVARFGLQYDFKNTTSGDENYGY